MFQNNKCTQLARGERREERGERREERGERREERGERREEISIDLLLNIKLT
jgi:hypothetical protein